MSSPLRRYVSGVHDELGRSPELKPVSRAWVRQEVERELGGAQARVDAASAGAELGAREFLAAVIVQLIERIQPRAPRRIEVAARRPRSQA